MNPFFTEYKYIPFDKIAETDYEPAMIKGMEEQIKEIDEIVNNPESPSFENTIEAYESTGSLLDKVTNVFFNLLSAETTDFLDEHAQKMSPILSEHSNNILLNEKLFARIKAVYDDNQRDDFGRLNVEQKMLLTKCYEGFVNNGANLPADKKEVLRKITAEMGVLSLKFSQNKLKDTNDFILHIVDTADLEGLPESAIDLAAQTAKDKGLEGYVFTLQAPSYTPFMTYSSRRELRKKMYMAFNTLCTHDNENNNVEIVGKIVNLHREVAQLLGYADYAEYALKRRMAENSSKVYDLLNSLIDAYMPKAKEDIKEAEDLYYVDNGIDPSTLSESSDLRFRQWDFSYYFNKLKEAKYNINSEMLRPYFQLSKVKEGVFGLASKLYGISFRKNAEVPVYHPDVEAYDVLDKDGSYLALFYCDFYPRESKKSGAWMTSYKDQRIEKDGTNSRPQVSIVMNFTKPTETKPALLTLGEVETFLHEFGHSLHGMFANTTYQSLSGTSVYWDFVELPSQIMENFCIEKEFLNTFAYHYQTGEALPQELIDRIVASRNFNTGYLCMRQVSFGLLDMAYYTMQSPFDSKKLFEFEENAWKKAQLLPSIEGCNMTVQFSHIMAGGYSAGYYSYKWAEVLDADAFSVFKEKGIFNTEVAQSFRDNILSKGGTEHPMTLYKRFRGQVPSIDALLKRNGIK